MPSTGSPSIVPFIDLNRQYRALQREIDEAIRSVIEAGHFILGDKVRQFEERFAEYCGANYAVGVASGTDALHLALRACGVGPGDEVITVANTCVPTVTGITMAGGVPVFVDIDAQTLTIDPQKIEAAITPKTKGLLPVHLYGRSAVMPSILGIAQRHGLRVIEDCAQAHGAMSAGLKVGTLGDAGCFSFYPTKNLGAFGDGGMVVTHDPSIAAGVRMLRTYGESSRYHHEIEGFNSRLDELQASILLAKLPHLDRWTAQRRAIAAAYNEALGMTEIRLPLVTDPTEHVFHLYVVRVRDRESFRTRMRAEGIGTLIHYPTPIPLQPAYAAYRPSMAGLTETERACEEVVSLPLFPEMTDEEVRRVIDACRRAIS